MRIPISIAAILTLAAGVSLAQITNQPATPGTALRPPAESQSDAAKPAAPNPGPALTETQAKSQIESEGYTNVSALKKDAKGMWNGMAMKNGKSVQVSLDLEGHVTELN